jgi:hypothetical protein
VDASSRRPRRKLSIPELPAGRYTLTAARTGYVTLSYGQRRPFQSGTPLQLTESESLTGIEIRLPRGSVVAGRVFDELGDPMPGIAVRALRYQYVQGTRQLVPAGLGQSDDRGEYRIWGLNPGEYFVSAVAPPNLPENFAGRRPPPAVVARGGRAFRCRRCPSRSGRGVRSPPEIEAVAHAPIYYPGAVGQRRPRRQWAGAESAGIDFTFCWSALA